jgi:hypothetical protein
MKESIVNISWIYGKYLSKSKHIIQLFRQYNNELISIITLCSKLQNSSYVKLITAYVNINTGTIQIKQLDFV